MARNYANVFTAIWKPGGDFVRRSGDAQRLYLLLVTQPEISAVGVLPLRVTRWTRKSGDATEEGLLAALAELEEHRYVVVDEDTEEVLVRSFTRHDGGFSNPRRQPSIRDGANAIESPRLVRVLAEEFERLDLPAKFRGQAKPQVDSHSDSQPMGIQTSTDCLTDSRRVVVTKGPYIDPQPPTPNPQPATAANRDSLAAEPAGPEGEGVGVDEDPIEELTAQVLELRPEWSRRSVRDALRDGTDNGRRPWALVGAAMLEVAKDKTSTAPGRLKHDGPWWSTAAEAVNARASPRPDIGPHCGECGPNRLVDLDDGRAARCPRCHPKRARGGAA